jgi:NADPH2:quinone reductase
MGRHELNREIGEAIEGMISEGFVRPIIGARFPLAQAKEALCLIDERGATGKVVLEIP